MFVKQRIAVDVDGSRCCGAEEFEGVEHCAGGDVPIAGTLFAAAIVGIRVDELVEADSDLLDAAEATIGLRSRKRIVVSQFQQIQASQLLTG